MVMAKYYKNKIWDTVCKGNITINVALFARVPEMTYSIEKMEQLLGNLQLDGKQVPPPGNSKGGLLRPCNEI